MDAKTQAHIWEKEYRNPKLVTMDSKPQASMMRFLKYLKKSGFSISGARVLDLGSGTGRNANHLAGLGAEAYGIEIAPTAVKLSRERARELGATVEYREQSIGSIFPYADDFFDLILDVTSSNSLNSKEREIYLRETARVLKPGAYFFARALALEGDLNAKKLLKLFPGPEKDVYVMPEIGLAERVFSRADFLAEYGQYFTVIKLDKETSYTKFNNQSFRRNFWIAYLRKNVG